MENRNENFQEYLIILHENQMSIKHLTANVEKLSLHLDKMVEKQVEMLIQHKELKVVKTDIDTIDERLKKLENNQQWTVRGFIGGVFAIVTSMIVFFIKGGNS